MYRLIILAILVADISSQKTIEDYRLSCLEHSDFHSFSHCIQKRNVGGCYDGGCVSCSSGRCQNTCTGSACRACPSGNCCNGNNCNKCYGGNCCATESCNVCANNCQRSCKERSCTNVCTKTCMQTPRCYNDHPCQKCETSCESRCKQNVNCQRSCTNSCTACKNLVVPSCNKITPCNATTSVIECMNNCAESCQPNNDDNCINACSDACQFNHASKCGQCFTTCQRDCKDDTTCVDDCQQKCRTTTCTQFDTCQIDKPEPVVPTCENKCSEQCTSNDNSCRVNCQQNCNQRSCGTDCTNQVVPISPSNSHVINSNSNSSSKNDINISSQSRNENPHTNNITFGIKNSVHNVNNIHNPVNITNVNTIAIQGKHTSTMSCSGSPNNQVCNQTIPIRNNETEQVPVRVPVYYPVRIPMPMPMPMPMPVVRPSCQFTQQAPYFSCQTQQQSCNSCYHCGGQYNPSFCSTQSFCSMQCRNMINPCIMSGGCESSYYK